MELQKENWKEDHLNFLHKEFYEWCPLCVAKKEGEGNIGQELGVQVGDKLSMQDRFGK